MRKRIHLIWIILLFSFIFYETGLPQSQSQYALIQRPVWQNPLIWKLTKIVTESAWGHNTHPHYAETYSNPHFCEICITKIKNITW